MKISVTSISKRQHARFYIYKKRKNTKRFYIQKARHSAKSKTISVTFLYTKIMTLYVKQILMKFLKLAFIYKNHDTLGYATFIYIKSRTLLKNQDNLRSVFIYKIWTLCVTRFLIEFLKLAEVGGNFYI